jgi:hypothetical protein
MSKDFDEILEAFKKHTLNYKLTGNFAHKMAASNAGRWLDSYIESVTNAAKGKADYIDKFVKEYADTNPELDKMTKQIKKVREKGPKLSDMLTTERESVKETEEPNDLTSYYIKAGVIGTGLAIVAVASFFP